MLGHYLDHFEVLNGYTLITRLARHTRTLEDLSRIRTRTYRPGSTKTVVLTVRSLTDTAEAVTLDYTLESLTLGGTETSTNTVPSKKFTSITSPRLYWLQSNPLNSAKCRLGATPAFWK